MAKQDKFEELREKYSDEELAESFVFPHGLSEAEKKKADQELWEFRKKLLEEKTTEDRIYSGLLRIKYQITGYLETAEFVPGKDVSFFLQEYLRVTHRKQKELADELNIHRTRLSRIVNRREKLSLPIAYRLEGHSGDLIPALLWWKLLQKEVEQEIRTDKKERKKEKDKLKKVAYYG